MQRLDRDEVRGVIAAVRSEEDFCAALASPVSLIFDLAPDLLTLPDRVGQSHAAGKRLLIHLDLAAGIGKDGSGILYAQRCGVDGIISTRVNLIRTAREAGLYTVQRFFLVDSHSVQTTLEAVRSSRPDTVELMPGIACKVIADLAPHLSLPVIAGGLVETEEETEAAFSAGASAVSTGRRSLWR